MKLSRRQILATIPATTLITALPGCSSSPSPSRIEQTLAAHFGASVAASQPARTFARALAAQLIESPASTNPWETPNDHETRIVRSFLESTTFIMSQANGSELTYIAVSDPWNAACANQLTSPLIA